MTFYSNNKQKSYVLNPRGKPLYEDANRFGTKMLKKMGWCQGKGLGANLDGEQNFIRVIHKTNQMGMGYQDRDDQWRSHENQFNSLLNSLDDSKNASGNECVISDEDIEYRGFGLGTSTSQTDNKKPKSVRDSLSGNSLEEMSKQSNARVHYRKFTRGKDISKYSEKDLANIFGKKHMYNNEESTLIKEEIETLTNIKEPAVDIEMNIIETGTTINDYFKTKKDERSKRDKNRKYASEHIANVEVESHMKRQKKDERVISVPILTAVDHTFSEKKQKKKSTKEKREKKKKEKEKSVICVEVQNDAEQEAECNNANAVIDQASKRSKMRKTVMKAKKNDYNMASVRENEVIAGVSKSCTNFVETILTALVNINVSGASSSTVLTQLDKDDAGTKKGDTDRLNYFIYKNKTQSYEINQFQAEIFRFVDLNGFSSANLSDICGYGFAASIDLKVTEKTRDRTKINDLWDDALVNKYGKNVFQAKKKKRYSIKALNKRKLFTGL